MGSDPEGKGPFCCCRVSHGQCPPSPLPYPHFFAFSGALSSAHLEQEFYKYDTVRARPDIWGFRFSGQGSIAATVAHLMRTAGLANASEVLLTGASAGGIGVNNNCDWCGKGVEHILGSP